MRCISFQALRLWPCNSNASVSADEGVRKGPPGAPLVGG